MCPYHGRQGLSLFSTIWSRRHQWDPDGYICLCSVFEHLNEMPAFFNEGIPGENLNAGFCLETGSSDVVATCSRLGEVQAPHGQPRALRSFRAWCHLPGQGSGAVSSHGHLFGCHGRLPSVLLLTVSLMKRIYLKQKMA